MSETALCNLRDYLYGTLSKSNLLWLATQLTEYAQQEEVALPPYTMEEIDTMLDEAERDFENGDYLTNEEVFHPKKNFTH